MKETTPEQNLTLVQLAAQSKATQRKQLVAYEAREKLYGMIRDALADGIATRSIAIAAGVTQPRVVQIGKGRK